MAQADQLRRILTESPFLPFELRMADGTLYRVRHPDYLSVPPVPRPREVAYYELAATQTEEPPERYTVRWLDLALISEVIEPARWHENRAPVASEPG